MKGRFCASTSGCRGQAKRSSSSDFYTDPWVNVVLPLASSLLAFVFAGMVLDQWFQRRHSFQLVWAIGLLWYGVAAGTEFLGSAFGWNEALYRTWYLIGAFLVPAYLGAGTLYLLNKTRFGYFAAASIALGGLFSALAIARYPGSAAAGYTTLAVRSSPPPPSPSPPHCGGRCRRTSP